MKRIITILSTILCVLTVAARPDGLTIHYLGANNTLVRVDEPRKHRAFMASAKRAERSLATAGGVCEIEVELTSTWWASLPITSKPTCA